VSAWVFPGVVSNYPNLAVGRDNGMLVWGKPLGGTLVYSVGAFNGHNRAVGLSNVSDKMLYAGRLAVALWIRNRRPPTTEGGTYYGSKDNLHHRSVRAGRRRMAPGPRRPKATSQVWSLDALLEKRIGVLFRLWKARITKYDLGGVVDCGSGEPGSVACPVADNVGGQVAGQGLSAERRRTPAGPRCPEADSAFIRYQKYDRDLSSTTSKATDFGVNYLLNGSNGKISLV